MGRKKAAADNRCLEYKLQLACWRRRNLKVVLYTPVATAVILFPTDSVSLAALGSVRTLQYDKPQVIFADIDQRFAEPYN